MHNSPVVRLAIGCLIVMAALLGFVFDEFVYVLGADSPLIPAACVGALIVCLWSADSLLD